MRRSLLALVVSFGLVTSLGSSAAVSLGNAASPQSAGKSSTASLKGRFVGTWKLVNIEQRNARGEVIPSAASGNPARTGYIIYDPAGYVAVSICLLYTSPSPRD